MVLEFKATESRAMLSIRTFCGEGSFVYSTLFNKIATRYMQPLSI